jgi:hypothetical protein
VRARLLLSAGVGICALAFAGTTFGAYNPALLVAGTSHGLGTGGPIVIGVAQAESDDATGVATFYSPRGYGARLTQRSGALLGAVAGIFKVGGPTGSRDDIEGRVVVDNPANHVGDTCAPGLHEAVWMLEFAFLRDPANTIRVPVYVDRVTAGPEAAFASARIQICLGSPYVPPPAGAPSGASLVVAAFSVGGVFSNPRTRGSHAWNGVFVPYTPGTATLNQANSAQSTSSVRLPVRLTLRATRQRSGSRTFAVATACLSESGQAVRGVRVNILSGPTAGLARRRVASGRTNARGCFTTTLRVRTRLLFLRASLEIPARTATGCRPTIVPRCTDSSIAPAFDVLSRTVHVKR